MTIKRILLLAGLLATTAACAQAPQATRATPFEAPVIEEIVPSFDIEKVRVRVPQSLTVSEANVYYPLSDIVWRGDAIGNRHEQVAALFNEALRQTDDQMTGLQPVNVDIQVIRFHSLTEKARYTVGGVHNVVFYMTVYDAETGAVLAPKRKIESNLDALGGRAAVAADAMGQTQKVRVTAHLVQTFARELAQPIAVTAPGAS